MFNFSLFPLPTSSTTYELANSVSTITDLCEFDLSSLLLYATVTLGIGVLLAVACIAQPPNYLMDGHNLADLEKQIRVQS